MSKAIVLEFRYSTSAFAGAAMRGRKVQRNLHFPSYWETTISTPQPMPLLRLLRLFCTKQHACVVSGTRATLVYPTVNKNYSATPGTATTRVNTLALMQSWDKVWQGTTSHHISSHKNIGRSLNSDTSENTISATRERESTPHTLHNCLTAACYKDLCSCAALGDAVSFDMGVLAATARH